jgi:hypothetical protein
LLLLESDDADDDEELSELLLLQSDDADDEKDNWKSCCYSTQMVLTIKKN